MSLSERQDHRIFRILTVGDPHFKNDNGEITEEMTVKIINLIKSNLGQLDAVAILGDILHRHEKIDLHPFHRALRFLSGIHEVLLSSMERKFLYILIGNHDRSNNQVFMTDEHVFGPLKLWENTFVVDEAILHDPYDDFRILLMPYVPPGRFKEAYMNVLKSEEELNNEVNLVLAHQEFCGAKMNTITSNEGDPWDILKPLCVSGHIHDYQELKTNLIYIGTPIQHGFADTCRKTISIFTFTGPRKYKEERIDLNIKGRVTLRCMTNTFNLLEIPFDKYFVKVKVSGTKREIKDFIESSRYKENISKGVVFQFLELPTVEIDQKILGEISENQNKFNSGISFKDRLVSMLETIEPSIKREFHKLFDKF